MAVEYAVPGERATVMTYLNASFDPAAWPAVPPVPAAAVDPAPGCSHTDGVPTVRARSSDRRYQFWSRADGSPWWVSPTTDSPGVVCHYSRKTGR